MSTNVVEMCSTGIIDVAGSALIRRQTSNPLTSGSLTSRITRSGSAATSRRASAPVVASWMAYPALCTIFAIAYRLASSSSTIRIVPVGVSAMSVSRPRGRSRRTRSRSRGQSRLDQGLPDRLGAGLPGPGRLVEDSDGPRLEPTTLVVVEVLRGVDDHGDRPGGVVPPEAVEHLEAGHVGHDHVEEDGVGPRLDRASQPVDAAAGLDHPVRADGGELPLEDVAGLLLVVDDQDRPGGPAVDD